MTTPNGAPCWLDLLTSDEARAREFYTGLFGWTAGESSPEFGGYFMFFRDGAPVAGAMPKMPGMENLPDVWGTYLAVDDIRKSVERAREAGAAVQAEPMDVADLGTSAILADPGGAQVGLWQAGTFAGLANTGQPGAPGWFELHTRAYDASVAFYRDVLGWDAYTAADEPEFRYTTLGKDDGARAGIMDATAFLGEQGAHWSVYFASADVDADVDTVTELGGSVLMPAEDTPYGRLALVADPTGAQFKFRGPATSR
jgi:predicted enzyme related to lactoylglutathione lyase